MASIASPFGRAFTTESSDKVNTSTAMFTRTSCTFIDVCCVYVVTNGEQTMTNASQTFERRRPSTKMKENNSKLTRWTKNIDDFLATKKTQKKPNQNNITKLYSSNSFVFIYYYFDLKRSWSCYFNLHQIHYNLITS